MCLLDNLKHLFQLLQMQQATDIPSILPPAAVQCIKSGKLPQINTNTVFLSFGEYVHYIDRAILITEKNMVTGYTGGSSGWSFPVFKGVRYRTGRYHGTPKREDVQENTKGILYFTSERVIFAAKKNGFDKKINSISTIIPYSSGMDLQIGNTTYMIKLPNGSLAFSVITMLRP